MKNEKSCGIFMLFCAQKHHYSVFLTKGIHFADLFLPNHQNVLLFWNQFTITDIISNMCLSE